LALGIASHVLRSPDSISKLHDFVRFRRRSKASGFNSSSDLHNLVGLKILTVVTNLYATHAGTTRRLDSGASVFNNYAPLDGNADSGSG